METIIHIIIILISIHLFRSTDKDKDTKLMYYGLRSLSIVGFVFACYNLILSF